jgi:hypothetical protein
LKNKIEKILGRRESETQLKKLRFMAVAGVDFPDFANSLFGSMEGSDVLEVADPKQFKQIKKTFDKYYKFDERIAEKRKERGI